MIREHLSPYRQMALVALVAAAGAGTASGAVWEPIAVDAVTVGGQIGDRIRLTVENNIGKIDIDDVFVRPFVEKKGVNGAFIGTGNLIESVVWLARHTGAPRLLDLKKRLVSGVIAAQGKDGYIGCMGPSTRTWFAWDVEDVGFILDGLIADWRLFRETASLEAAKRAADHVLASWKDPPDGWDGDIYDKELAMGLGHGVWSLYLVTGDERYRAFVADTRGYATCDEPIELGRSRGLRGHTAGYLDTCLTQLEMYLRTGDPGLFRQTRRFYDHMVRGNGGLVTGGTGFCECWSGDQQDAGFCSETCMSAYALTVYDLSIRTGAADAAIAGDLMERTLYNAFFAAQSGDGRRLRYYTPLRGTRPWWPTDDYCCPCNYRRVIGYLPSYVFYANGDGILANLYTAAKAKLSVRGTSVAIDETTDYPSSGRIALSVAPEKPLEFALSVRVPGWCANPRIAVNGESVAAVSPGSLCAIRRTWTVGDRVELDFPMEPVAVRGRARQAGRFAVLRGPLVYAISSEPLKGLAAEDKDIAKCFAQNGLDLSAVPDHMTVDPASLRAVRDDSVRPGGTAVEANAVFDPYAFGLAPEKIRRIRLTEFADERNDTTYFRAPDPSAVAREDRLLCPPAPDRARWMRGRYGVMVHWLFPSEGDVDRWTDRFDLAAFLADFDRTGADWLIFTAGQCRGAYASPNATLDRYCGPGHTSRRDLVREIARAVKSRGKRFVVYSAVDFMKDGCKDHAMQRGLCWDPASSDRTEFQRRWPAVLAEWSRRLGRDCDGWWLDGCAPKEYPKGVDWQAWLDACRAGNADAAVAFNGGVHTFAVRWGASDFEAGEAAALSAVEADLALPRECPGLQRHYLFPVDGYWGAFWPWPKGDWARTQELQKTRPELFDGEKMAARLEARDFPEPICGADRLGRILERAARINAAVTVNVGISPEGRLNPKSVELLRRAADAHAILVSPIDR